MTRNNKLKNFLLNFFTYIVLKEISTGVSTPKKIAIKYGRSIQNVNYYIKKLYNLGYIRKKFRSSQGNVYELTSEGRRILLELDEHHNGSQVKKFSGGMRLRVRLHGLRFVFPVLERGLFRFDRSWVLRNWEKRYSDFGSISIEEVPGKVILYVKRVYDGNVYRGLYRAFRAALIFGRYFQKVTGYKLGFPEFDDRQLQIAIEDDPLAAALLSVSNARIYYREGDRGLGVDASDGRPELEFIGRIAPIDASKYLNIPDMLDLILERISQLEENQVKFVQTLDRLTRIFEKIFGDLVDSDKSGERRDSPHPEGWYM